MIENWKAIPGFEGHYEVSDLGRVRSLDREVFSAGNNGRRAYRSLREGVVLSAGRTASGHYTVALTRGAGSFYVHRLVMLAFVGEPPQDHEVCHANGDPADNRLENLRYDTRSANNIDASKQGARGRLTEEQVRQCRAAVGVPGALTAFAKEWNVGLTCLSNAAHGRTYRWVA